MNRPGNRALRRQGVAEQRKAVSTGAWPAWTRHVFPKGSVGGNGWAYEIAECFENKIYSVLVRLLDADKTGRVHLAISTLNGREPPWRDLQRIKNELFGEDRAALQVYPQQSRLIDGADMYHLWLLPVGAELGFGLHRLDADPHARDVA